MSTHDTLGSATKRHTAKSRRNHGKEHTWSQNVPVTRMMPNSFGPQNSLFSPQLAAGL